MLVLLAQATLPAAAATEAAGDGAARVLWVPCGGSLGFSEVAWAWIVEHLTTDGPQVQPASPAEAARCSRCVWLRCLLGAGWCLFPSLEASLGG